MIVLMPKVNQNGFAHIFVLLLLIIGLGFGVYMVSQKTNLFSRASYVSSPVVATAFGKSIYLNSSANNVSFVKIPTKSVQNPSANFTVEAWIRPDLPTSAVGVTEYSTIISKSKTVVFNDAYSLIMTATPQADGDIKYDYQFSVTTGAFSNITAYTSNGTVNDAQGNPISSFKVSRDEFKTWRHVAGVVSNGNLYIYSNGTLVGKNEYGMTNFGSAQASIQIGARMLADGTMDNFFKGEIDEVRISNVARYTTNVPVPPSPFLSDANTVSLIHFDGNFLDSSSYRNNAEGVSRMGGFVFVNSAAGIVPTPIPTNAATPTPQGGGDNDPVPAGCYRVPVVGIVCPPIGGPSDPEPTIAPTAIPTPTLAPRVQGCADANGKGANGITCINYIRFDSNLCPNNVYPYLYASCDGGEFTPKCQDGYVLNNGVCVPNPQTQGACANSEGNGPDGIKCQVSSYYASSNEKCSSTKDIYPYFYTKCTVPSLTPTPNLTQGGCADSAGNGANGLKCTLGSYNSGKNKLCPNKDLYGYYYESCQR